MSDLIDRQAAIDALMVWEEDSFWDKECLKHRGEPYWVAPSDVIEQMSAVQPEQRWIPCSERLPDRFGKMLVTFIPAAGTIWTRVIIANYSDLMGIAKPCFWIGNVGKSDFANITSRVVAWMPLPEPYKGDEQG